MNDWLVQLIEHMQVVSGASEKSLTEVELFFGFTFPTDYRELMLKTNGAIGPVGKESYLVLWPIEELPQNNRECLVEEFAPGLCLFGTDGGGEAYAFDISSQPIKIVEIPLIGMNLRYARVVGYTLKDLVQYLK